VLDPDLGRDLVSLNMIQDIRICGGAVSFRLVLTTPACPVRAELENEARRVVESVPGVTQVGVRVEASVPRHKTTTEKRPIEGDANVVAVTSGKGGVGKTTVAVNLACALAKAGARVGLLDCDIYGPNVPIMLGVNKPPEGDSSSIQPIEAHGLKVMSMGFVAQADTPLIWRGPMLHSAIQQFLYQVVWGDLDYLIVDLPPGTGDAQLSIMQSTPLAGGLVVTTPQDVALADARRGVMMFRQVGVEVLGIIENMSYFICPNCGSRTDIFSHGGGERTSREYQVPFLGSIPLAAELRVAGDRGRPIVLAPGESPIGRAFEEIAGRVAGRVSTVNLSEKYGGPRPAPRGYSTRSPVRP
jgi:ATP-binding protein involved in chromosome partitioning